MNQIDRVKKVLRGPMVPIITSFKDDLSLDLAAIEDNTRFLVERGIVTGKGVMLGVGAGGDFPMLSVEERKQVARGIVNAVDGQAPVIIGVQDTNPRVCLELAEHACQIGANGIQVGPPYYYHPSDRDVIAFYQAINDAVALPVMVYNTHWLGYDMSFDVLDALTEMKQIHG